MIKIIFYIFSVCAFMCMEGIGQHQVSLLRRHLPWLWCLFICLFETRSHWDLGLIDHVHVPSTEVTILCHYTWLFSGPCAWDAGTWLTWVTSPVPSLAFFTELLLCPVGNEFYEVRDCSHSAMDIQHLGKSYTYKHTGNAHGLCVCLLAADLEIWNS